MAQALATLREDETIGILLFTRKHLPRYLQALYDAGLAVRVREGLKLAESRTRGPPAQSGPGPDPAPGRSGLGRGAPGSLGPPSPGHPGPGGPDPGGSVAREIAPLCNAGQDDWTADLAGLAESLEKARGQVGRRPLADILTDWLEATRAWTGIAAWEGPLGVANARAYLDLLAAAEEGLPEATFVKADFNLQEAFQPPDPQAQASPVEILTVHGAKGLEFHQVFLPFLDWQPLKSEDKTPPFLLEEISGRGASTAWPWPGPMSRKNRAPCTCCCGT